MGNVVGQVYSFVSVIGNLMPKVKQILELFIRRPPPNPVPFIPPPGKTKEQLIAEARSKLGLDPFKYNFAFCGASGSGTRRTTPFN